MDSIDRRPFVVGDRVVIADQRCVECGVAGMVRFHDADTGWFLVALEAGPPWRGYYAVDQLQKNDDEEVVSVAGNHGPGRVTGPVSERKQGDETMANDDLAVKLDMVSRLDLTINEREAIAALREHGDWSVAYDIVWPPVTMSERDIALVRRESHTMFTWRLRAKGQEVRDRVHNPVAVAVQSSVAYVREYVADRLATTAGRAAFRQAEQESPEKGPVHGYCCLLASHRAYQREYAKVYQSVRGHSPAAG